MAAISDGVLGFRDLSGKRLARGGGSSLFHKAAGFGSSMPLVNICSYSNYSENQKKNAGGNQAMSSRKGSQSKWWLPIFGWSPDEKWTEEVGVSTDKSAVQNTVNATGNVFKADEEEISVTKRSKFVAVRFTAEKAKLLRKNLRSTSSFHDLMYHSAIASRLASADSSSE